MHEERERRCFDFKSLSLYKQTPIAFQFSHFSVFSAFLSPPSSLSSYQVHSFSFFFLLLSFVFRFSQFLLSKFTRSHLQLLDRWRRFSSHRSWFLFLLSLFTFSTDFDSSCTFAFATIRSETENRKRIFTFLFCELVDVISKKFSRWLYRFQC